MRKNNKSLAMSLAPSLIQSHLNQDLRSFVESEVLEFYDYFMDITSSISTEVDNYEILEENGKKFAVYNIAVRTSFLDYNVMRRYSQFYTLREKLIKSCPDLGIQNLPFPEKKFFGNLMEGTLQLRVTGLDEFLKLVSMRSGHFPMVDFWEFLDIRVRYSLEMRKLAASPQKILPAKSRSEEASILFNLIEQLNKEPLEITNTLKEIDKFYSNRKPRLGADMAKTLLLGAGKARGLLYFCGKIDKESNTHLSCSIGLPLLLSLMSYDNNKEAEIFQEIFGNCKLKNIKELNLENHLIGETQRRCKQPALQLVDIYINKHPTIDLDSLFSIPQARQEFLKWKYPRQNNSRKNEKFKIPEVNSALMACKQKRINMTNADKLFSPSSQHTHETEETSSSSPKKHFIRSEAPFDMLAEEKIGWTKVTTRDNDLCQIRHQNFVNLGFHIIVKGTPESCIPYLTEKLSWMPNFYKGNYKKKEDSDSFEKLVKLKYQDIDTNYIVFFYKGHISEDENGAINIIQKSKEGKDIKLADNETMGCRNCKISLVPIRMNCEEFQTKIKITIKNLDNISIRYSTNEMSRDIGKIEESLYDLKGHIERNLSP